MWNISAFGIDFTYVWFHCYLSGNEDVVAELLYTMTKARNIAFVDKVRTVGVCNCCVLLSVNKAEDILNAVENEL